MCSMQGSFENMMPILLQINPMISSYEVSYNDKTNNNNNNYNSMQHIKLYISSSKTYQPVIHNIPGIYWYVSRVVAVISQAQPSNGIKLCEIGARLRKTEMKMSLTEKRGPKRAQGCVSLSVNMPL